MSKESKFATEFAMFLCMSKGSGCMYVVSSCAPLDIVLGPDNLIAEAPESQAGSRRYRHALV